MDGEKYLMQKIAMFRRKLLQKKRKSALRTECKGSGEKREKICAFFQLDVPEKICYNNKAVTRKAWNGKCHSPSQAEKKK